MSLIGNPAQTGLMQMPPGGYALGGAMVGNARVESREVDMADLIQDSAEELTQSLSGKAQERSLRERRASSGKDMAELTAERVREIMALMAAQSAGGSQSQTPADAEQKRIALAREVLKQPGKALQLVREQGGGPTEQFLSLLDVAELIAQGKAGPDPGGRGQEAAREAAAELMAEYGREIRADINTLDVTRDMAAGLAPAFRTAYKDAVMGQEGLGATVRHLLELVPQGQGQDFLQVLDRMQKALGLDLAATSPSTEPAHLQALVSDLFHLKVISTVLDEGQQLSKTLVQRHAVPPLSSTELTTELLMTASDRWVDASRFENLGRRLVASEDLGAQVSFHTGLRGLIRQLPVQVFASMEARQTVMEASQTALDTAIDREEGLI